MTNDVDAVAERVRAALSAPNLDGFADLLDENVTWGAGGDPTPPCQNRRQVLAWYARARDAGRDAHVEQITTHTNKILLATRVSGEPEEPPALRWQVLTVAGGRIVDIRGYDDEAAAHAAAQSGA